jgi:hypothetical protein
MIVSVSQSRRPCIDQCNAGVHPVLHSAFSASPTSFVGPIHLVPMASCGHHHHRICRRQSVTWRTTLSWIWQQPRRVVVKAGQLRKNSMYRASPRFDRHRTAGSCSSWPGVWSVCHWRISRAIFCCCSDLLLFIFICTL